jgi:hypothetical protein
VENGAQVQVTALLQSGDNLQDQAMLPHKLLHPALQPKHQMELLEENGAQVQVTTLLPSGDNPERAMPPQDLVVEVGTNRCPLPVSPRLVRVYSRMAPEKTLPLW